MEMFAPLNSWVIVCGRNLAELGVDVTSEIGNERMMYSHFLGRTCLYLIHTCDTCAELDTAYVHFYEIIQVKPTHTNSQKT